MDCTKKYHKVGWQTGNPKLYATNSQRAKEMRKKPTEAELVFWNAIKGGKLGTKVRRQVTIGEYIVDFLIPQYRIVIEIDGGYHDTPEQKEVDRKRQEWLEKNGYKVIRFRNEEVVASVDMVKERIKASLPSPLPIQGKGC